MSQGASKVNISFVVCTDQLEEAILQLHRCFFEDRCSVESFEPDVNGAVIEEEKKEETASA